MKNKRKREKRNRGELALQIVRASLLACIATAILVLILAFLIRWEWFSVQRIHMMNTFIKTVNAAFAGLLIGLRIREHGWIPAGISGVIYILLSYIAFSLIERDFSVTWLFATDLLLGFICAAVAQIFVRVLKEMRAPQ